jgi:transcriptional regulator with XRE-family HTH domain
MIHGGQSCDDIVRALYRRRVEKYKSRVAFTRRHPFATDTMVYRWENGHMQPSLAKFIEWANALGYRVELTPVQQ